jgi:hypothetical protein
MFTQCPEMAVWLLERSGLRFPEYQHIEVADGRFTLVTAVGEKEMAADLVLICRDSRRVAVQVFIVEIQRGRGPDKVRSCHVYQAVYWAVLDCPVALVMVCSRREVARRFMKEFNAGVQDQVTPAVVLDLDLVPVLSQAEAENAPPEWVLLDLLEEFMALLEDEEFTFEAEIFTRRIKAAEERAAQTAAEAAGQAGEARGEGKSLLSVLDARGFAVIAALRKEILACSDTARMEDALRRAATGDPGQPFTF